jgi:hypothetical protein
LPISGELVQQWLCLGTNNGFVWESTMALFGAVLPLLFLFLRTFAEVVLDVSVKFSSTPQKYTRPPFLNYLTVTSCRGARE